MADANERSTFRVVQGGASREERAAARKAAREAQAEARSAARGQRGGQSSLRGARSANEVEFERLYRENFKLVYNYIYSRFLDQSFTEEVVSEAFIKAARAFNSFDPKRAKFSTWVITIARNCATSMLRKKTHEVSESDTDLNLDWQSTTDTYDGLEEDNRQLLAGVLRKLDETERELIALKYVQNMRNQEIAEVLGMNASTVGTKLQRAVAKMRRVAGSAGA